MIRGLVGRTEADLEAKASAEQLADLRSREAVVGTPNEIVDRLGKLSEVGVAGVQLQWLDLDDITGLELIASDVLPQLK
jgi:alkanesulfonate monooxygenase SsuD/methylene tetrahydromethanopterin reductase-like flavin-dependent oxidoreductase (luciferase family)